MPLGFHGGVGMWILMVIIHPVLLFNSNVYGEPIVVVDDSNDAWLQVNLVLVTCFNQIKCYGYT